MISLQEFVTGFEAYGLIKSTDGMKAIDKQPLKILTTRGLFPTREIWRLLQNPELIDRLNVFDNVSLPLRIRGISQMKLTIE